MKVKAVSCPSCGASWGVDKDKTQVFCPYCGTKIVLQNEDGNKSKRTKKIVLAICAMIVLATITVGVWLFVDISGRKASDEASVSEVETLSVAINTYIQNEYIHIFIGTIFIYCRYTIFKLFIFPKTFQ